MIGGGGTVRDANITFGPYNSALLKAGNVDPDWSYSLGNVINIWPKAFARVNAGLDEFSKRLTYLGEARVRAHVEAAGQGLSGDEAGEFVRRQLTGAFDEAGAATDQGLLAAAERTTFTGTVGSIDSLARLAGTLLPGTMPAEVGSERSKCSGARPNPPKPGCALRGFPP